MIDWDPSLTLVVPSPVMQLYSGMIDVIANLLQSVTQSFEVFALHLSWVLAIFHSYFEINVFFLK